MVFLFLRNFQTGADNNNLRNIENCFALIYNWFWPNKAVWLKVAVWYIGWSKLTVGGGSFDSRSLCMLPVIASAHRKDLSLIPRWLVTYLTSQYLSLTFAFLIVPLRKMETEPDFSSISHIWYKLCGTDKYSMGNPGLILGVPLFVWTFLLFANILISLNRKKCHYWPFKKGSIKTDD